MKQSLLLSPVVLHCLNSVISALSVDKVPHKVCLCWRGELRVGCGGKNAKDVGEPRVKKRD
jgi:hypothetical protein